MTVRVEGLCDLCSIRGPVEAGLVAWRRPLFRPFENVDRCPDQEACRARVEARGEEWPVIEARREP